MPRENISDIIRRCFAAYRAKDRKTVEALLADDFTFTSPYDDAIGKDAYFARCWPNSERIQGHVIENIFVQGSEAFMLYRCITTKGDEFRNTELFTFAGDRISRIDVYFGATYRDGAFVRSNETIAADG